MPATAFPPKSSERKRDATRSVLDRASPSVDTSFSSKLGNDTNQVPELDSAEHAQYQEFERNQVFVGVEVFMKHVLHVPEGWRKLWGRTIEKIKHEKAFSTAHLNYSYQCDAQGVGEGLCEPLVDMTNAILRCSNLPLEDCIEPRTHQRYVSFSPHLYFKLSGSALVDGSCMPRLKLDGKPSKASRNVVSQLIGNRARFTGRSCIPLHAEGNSFGCRPIYRRRSSLSAGTWSIPEAACGRALRIQSEDSEDASQIDSGRCQQSNF